MGIYKDSLSTLVIWKSDNLIAELLRVFPRPFPRIAVDVNCEIGGENNVYVFCILFLPSFNVNSNINVINDWLTWLAQRLRVVPRSPDAVSGGDSAIGGFVIGGALESGRGAICGLVAFNFYFPRVETPDGGEFCRVESSALL